MRHQFRYSLVRPRPTTEIRQIKGDYQRVGYALYDSKTEMEIGSYMHADASMAYHVLSRRSRELGYATPNMHQHRRTA